MNAWFRLIAGIIVFRVASHFAAGLGFGARFTADSD